MLFVGSLTQEYANVLNTNSSCLPIDYSSFCQGHCISPATCSSSTGRCVCPLTTMSLVVYGGNSTSETCICPNAAFFTYNGSACVSSINDTGKKIDISFVIIIHLFNVFIIYSRHPSNH